MSPKPVAARLIESPGTTGVLLATLALLAACGPAAEPPAPEVRPVRVVTIETRVGGETASLTGTVQSQTDVNLSFRVDGRMVTRSVNVGDTVRAGQLVATLNPENEQNSVTSARAQLSAAQGQLTEARNNLERNKRLLAQNFISQAAFDQITQVERTARAQVDSAQAQLNIAQNRLGYTRLSADVGGVVTAVGAEPGEVVQGGRMIVQLATESGRDAVFDVPAQIKDSVPANADVTVTLSMNAAASAMGRVREVSPRADPVTGTFRVRVGLTKPPAAMRLGSTVTGRVKLETASGVSIPASALVRSDRQTAVWVVDPKAMTVSSRAISVGESTASTVAVASGLNPGDIVVTAGAQALRPGQKVRFPESKQ
ncbi:MAG: efflux RND transporter periplasmic adaptor subunit [Burkholderiales bacterium]